MVTDRGCCFRIYTFLGFIAATLACLFNHVLFAPKITDQRLRGRNYRLPPFGVMSTFKKSTGA